MTEYEVILARPRFYEGRTHEHKFCHTFPSFCLRLTGHHRPPLNLHSSRFQTHLYLHNCSSKWFAACSNIQAFCSAQLAPYPIKTRAQLTIARNGLTVFTSSVLLVDTICPAGRRAQGQHFQRKTIVFFRSRFQCKVKQNTRTHVRETRKRCAQTGGRHAHQHITLPFGPSYSCTRCAQLLDITLTHQSHQKTNGAACRSSMNAPSC